MRLASVRPDQIAVVRDDGLVNVSDQLARQGLLPAGASLVDVITRYDSLHSQLDAAATSGTAKPVNEKELLPPISKPSKIWAAASNYKRGGSGLDSASGRGSSVSTSREDLLEMIFLKPPSAVTGPEGDVVIPPGADTIYPELELCVVIGKESRNLTREQALDAVFGYTIILDVTARKAASNFGGLVASRAVRKGYDTFAPIGPWITTKDEIPNPQALEMKLWLNDGLVQSASTDGMINGVVDLITYLSGVGTLYPGDLIATGNPDAPDFQQKLAPGDTLRAAIESIGSMTLHVRGA